MTKRRDWEEKPSLREPWIQEDPEKGIEKGKQEGREEGLRSLVVSWNKRGLSKTNALKLLEPQYHFLVEEIYGPDKHSPKDRNLIMNWYAVGVPEEIALRRAGSNNKDIVEEIYGSDKLYIKDLNLD